MTLRSRVWTFLYEPAQIWHAWQPMHALLRSDQVVKEPNFSPLLVMHKAGTKSYVPPVSSGQREVSHLRDLDATRSTWIHQPLELSLSALSAIELSIKWNLHKDYAQWSLGFRISGTGRGEFRK